MYPEGDSVFPDQTFSHFHSSANIKVEDLFPYVDNKEKFVNDKSLKRQHFEEAIKQIEGALSGEGDPSPISTQPENGKPTTGSPEKPAAVPKGRAAQTKQQKASPATITAPVTGTIPPPAAAAAAQTKPPTKQKKATTAPVARGKAKAATANDAIVENPLTPPPDDEVNTTITVKEELLQDSTPDTIPTDDIMTQMEVKPVRDEEESPTNATSRSGRKIKPKKWVSLIIFIWNVTLKGFS